MYKEHATIAAYNTLFISFPFKERKDKKNIKIITHVMSKNYSKSRV